MLLSFLSLNFFDHQGICLNTPARTSAASAKASRTAQPSSDNPRRFVAITSPFAWLIASSLTLLPEIFLPSVFQPVLWNCVRNCRLVYANRRKFFADLVCITRSHSTDNH